MKRLALGAATGRSAARMSASATGCAGTLMPTASRPAVTMSGTLTSFGSTSVSGPGQKRLASRVAEAGHRRVRPTRVLHARHVHDHRVERRTTLRLEDATHRGGVEGVGAKSIHGLGGEGDEPAGPQYRRCRRDRDRVGRGRIDGQAAHATSRVLRQSSCGRRRSRLVSPRRFLVSRRRSFEARVGLVARRALGTASARATTPARRSSAAVRLRNWLR